LRGFAAMIAGVAGVSLAAHYFAGFTPPIEPLWAFQAILWGGLIMGALAALSLEDGAEEAKRAKQLDRGQDANGNAERSEPSVPAYLMDDGYEGHEQEMYPEDEVSAYQAYVRRGTHTPVPFARQSQRMSPRGELRGGGSPGPAARQARTASRPVGAPLHRSRREETPSDTVPQSRRRRTSGRGKKAKQLPELPADSFVDEDVNDDPTESDGSDEEFLDWEGAKRSVWGGKS
jgi:hypothetical protein